MEFLIIGGMAARLHDTGHATIEVDICPSGDDANLSDLRRYAPGAWCPSAG
ncbi:MAG: hypothetical protein ACNYZH_08240 [Acidimicrobiia bacterium]